MIWTCTVFFIMLFSPLIKILLGFPIQKKKKKKKKNEKEEEDTFRFLFFLCGWHSILGSLFDNKLY